MGEEKVVGKDRNDFYLVLDECEQKIILQYLRDLFRLTSLGEFWFIMEKLFDSPNSDLLRL